MRGWIVLVGLVGCRADFELTPSSPRGAAPLANAGTGTTVRIASPITLDAADSFDPDGILTSFRWTLSVAPDASTAVIVDDATAIASFTPDFAGLYTFELTVTDDDGNVASSRVTYNVIPRPLTVSAGVDIAAEWRKPVQLVGTIDYIEGPEPAVLSWSFVSRPPRSTAALLNGSTLTPSFVADVAGTYVLELAGMTSQHASTDTVTVVAAVQTVPFPGAFIDAVFVSDDETDRLVAISDSPPRVRFISPVTGAETTIALPSTPTALAMDQYENSLAVATAGQIHIFDLFTKTLTASYPVPFTAANLVFGPFQLVHAFTAQAGPIRTLDLSNGVVSATSFSVPAGTIGKLYLNNNAMYALDSVTTPPDITRYSLSVAPVTIDYDSPYNGQYALGSNLWVHFNGVVASSGNVFSTSYIRADDLLYRGHLGGEEPATVVSAFGDLPNLATLHSVATGTQPNHQLRLYDSATLAHVESAPLPDIVVNGVPQASSGRLILYSPSYTNKLVIVASAGSANAFFVTFR